MLQRQLSNKPLALDPRTTNEWEHHLRRVLAESKGEGSWRAKHMVFPAEGKGNAFEFEVSTCEARLLLVQVGQNLFRLFVEVSG